MSNWSFYYFIPKIPTKKAMLVVSEITLKLDSLTYLDLQLTAFKVWYS